MVFGAFDLIYSCICPILKEKALKFAHELDLLDFNALKRSITSLVMLFLVKLLPFQKGHVQFKIGPHIFSMLPNTLDPTGGLNIYRFRFMYILEASCHVSKKHSRVSFNMLLCHMTKMPRLEDKGSYCVSVSLNQTSPLIFH